MTERLTTRKGTSAGQKAEFRKGFYPGRPAHWIERVVYETESPSPTVAEHLAAIERGQRDFSYPGHDATVFRLLRSLIPEKGLRKGADIGCATGCFPAMQLACGIEKCTVFEVRDVEVSHPQIEVRIQDLSNEADLKPEFDLVTCLSTIEHVGLGRYGDRLDPWGDIKLAHNIRKLVRPGGLVLISFPAGAGCVVYNMHRIYTAYRRALLFEGYRVLGVHRGLSIYRRARHALGNFVRGHLGRFTQPVNLLTVA